MAIAIAPRADRSLPEGFWPAGTLNWRGRRIEVCWSFMDPGWDEPVFRKWYRLEGDGAFSGGIAPVLQQIRREELGVDAKEDELEALPVGARVGGWLKIDHIENHDHARETPWLWVDVTTGRTLGTASLAWELCGG